MLFMNLRALLCSVALLWGPAVSHAAPILVDFEAFTDSEVLTTQVPGLTFSNATVLSAGISLNELEFPPSSGTNVVFDDGGAMTIDFAAPIASFGGLFTYLTQLTVSAFDAALNLVASSVSAFLTNLALSGEAGSAPNEFLGVTHAGGISRVVIAGDPAGGSFVLDDLTYEAAVVTVPEPSTVALMLAGLVAGGLGARRRRSAI